MIGTRWMIQSAQQLGGCEPRLHFCIPMSFPTHTLVTALPSLGIKMAEKVVGDNNHSRRTGHSHFRHGAAKHLFDLPVTFLAGPHEGAAPL